MDLSIDLHLPAPTDAVVAAVTDEDFIRFTAERTGSRLVQVDVTSGPDGSATSAVRRTIASDQIPPHVRSFVGTELEIRQAEAWAAAPDAGQGERHATVAVEITGAPVMMTGTVRLAPAEDGTSVMTYAGEVRSSVPLFGAAVEKAAADAIERALQEQAVHLATWLGRDSTV